MEQIKNLFRRAKAHKIKLIDLAAARGCHVDTFQKWKKGINSPSLKVFAETEATLNNLIEQKYNKPDSALPPGSAE